MFSSLIVDGLEGETQLPSHSNQMVSGLVHCRDAAASQIDTTMTFIVLIVSIGQNEEFQKLRVHYTLAGIKPLLKIGEGGSGTPGTLPWPLATPLEHLPAAHST